MDSNLVLHEIESMSPNEKSEQIQEVLLDIQKKLQKGNTLEEKVLFISKENERLQKSEVENEKKESERKLKLQDAQRDSEKIPIQKDRILALEQNLKLNMDLAEDVQYKLETSDREREVIPKLKKRNAEQQETVASLENDLRNYEENDIKIRNQLHKETTFSKEKLQTVSLLESTLKNITEERDFHNSTVDELKFQIQNYKTKCNNYESELYQITDLETTLNENYEKNNQLEMTISKLITGKEELLKNCKLLENLGKNKEEESFNKIHMLHKDIDNQKNQKEIQAKEADNLRHEISYLEKETFYYRTNLSNLENELSVIPSLNENIDRLREDKENLVSKLDESLQTIKTWENTYEILKNKTDFTRNLEIENEKLVYEKEACERSLYDSEEKIKQLQKELMVFESFEQRINLLDEQNCVFQCGLRDTEEKLKLSNDKEFELYEKLENNQHYANSLELELKQMEMNKNLSDVQKQTMQNDLQISLNEMETARDGTYQTCDILQNEISMLKSKLAQKKRINAEQSQLLKIREKDIEIISAIDDENRY